MGRARIGPPTRPTPPTRAPEPLARARPPYGTHATYSPSRHYAVRRSRASAPRHTRTYPAARGKASSTHDLPPASHAPPRLPPRRPHPPVPPSRSPHGMLPQLAPIRQTEPPPSAPASTPHEPTYNTLMSPAPIARVAAYSLGATPHRPRRRRTQDPFARARPHPPHAPTHIPAATRQVRPRDRPPSLKHPPRARRHRARAAPGTPQCRAPPPPPAPRRPTAHSSTPVAPAWARPHARSAPRPLTFRVSPAATRPPPRPAARAPWRRLRAPLHRPPTPTDQRPRTITPTIPAPTRLAHGGPLRAYALAPPP
jgi:hypothetical protein